MKKWYIISCAAISEGVISVVTQEKNYVHGGFLIYNWKDDDEKYEIYWILSLFFVQSPLFCLNEASQLYHKNQHTSTTNLKQKVTLKTNSER